MLAVEQTRVQLAARVLIKTGANCTAGVCSAVPLGPRPCNRLRRWLFGLLLSIATASAAEVRELEWPDLLPQLPPLADVFADSPINIRYDLGFVAKVVADADSGVIDPQGPEYRNAMQVLERHRAAGVDVDTLMEAVAMRDREIQRRGEQVNRELDGVQVRMPGYALPLEFDGRGVTEFLLVPYVGACIHVPPPPANQIVFARLQTAYEPKDLYDPVWITGRLSAQPASTELFLVDGQAQVPMGYSMDVTDVVPME